MGNKKNLGFGILLISLIGIITIARSFAPKPEKESLRIACNDDAAGLLVKYMVSEDAAELEVVDMTYQQLQDCCSSQTELSLSASNFDMALLCPDSAKKLIEKGQPFQILGNVVKNANVLVTNEDIPPKTVGYMNLREIQKELVWSNIGKDIEMQPMLPQGLPYALQRKAVDGIVLDILGALKIDGYKKSLVSDYPTTVLVLHKDLAGSKKLDGFVKAYDLAVDRMNNGEILMKELAKHLDTEYRADEVMKIWISTGIKYEKLGINQ